MGSLIFKYVADQPKNVTNLPKIRDKEENQVTLTHNSDQAGISSFSSLRQSLKNQNEYIFEAMPLSYHVGNYSITIKLTDNHFRDPKSTFYVIHLVILPYNDTKKPEQSPLGERVRPIITSVTRGGKVTVRFSPSFKSTELPLKLSNQTVCFYIEKWEKDL